MAATLIFRDRVVFGNRVHADVAALQELGLIERVEAGLASQVDEITSTIRIAA